MWRETKILLIDDNAERRRDLAVILGFLGEDHIACASSEWREAVGKLESSREVLNVLLGDVSPRAGRWSCSSRSAPGTRTCRCW